VMVAAVASSAVAARLEPLVSCTGGEENQFQ
jgi:hypothetical protein